MPETVRTTPCACGDIEADAPGFYEIFLHDVVLACRIGVYESEHHASQRVRIDLELEVRRNGPCVTDDIGDVLSYDDIMHGIERIASGEHINLIETLAEKIADACLSNEHVLRARVTVVKLDVYAGAATPGVRVDRRRGAPPPGASRPAFAKTAGSP